MYVFREPVGRELVAQAALPGFAIDSFVAQESGVMSLTGDQALRLALTR